MRSLLSFMLMCAMIAVIGCGAPSTQSNPQQKKSSTVGTAELFTPAENLNAEQTTLYNKFKAGGGNTATFKLNKEVLNEKNFTIDFKVNSTEVKMENCNVVTKTDKLVTIESGKQTLSIPLTTGDSAKSATCTIEALGDNMYAITTK